MRSNGKGRGNATIVIYSRFHRNPFRGFGATGVEICPFPLLWLLAFTTACTAVQAVVSLRLYLDCWTETQDIHGLGGTPQPYIETLKECQAACLADPTCVAIDWTQCADGDKCWLLYTTTTQPTGWSFGGCSHYELDRTCTGWSVLGLNGVSLKPIAPTV